MKKTRPYLTCALIWILGIFSPVLAAFSPDTIFVANTPSSRSAGNDSIDQYSPDGRYLGTLVPAGLGVKGVRDVAYDPGTGHLLYTVDTWVPQVFEIREVDESGRVVAVYTHPDFGSGNIEIVFGPDNTLYIANSGHVYRKGPDDTGLTQFCSLPINPSTGHPAGIGDLEVDSSGILYLADPYLNHRIYRIFPDGSVDVYADQAAGLNEPFGIALDSRGNLFACNANGSNRAVIKILPSGQGQVFVPHGQLSSSAHDLAFDSQGYLVAACRNSHDLYRIDSQGNITDLVQIQDQSRLSDPASVTVIRDWPASPEPVPAAGPKGFVLSGLALAALGIAALGRRKCRQC